MKPKHSPIDRITVQAKQVAVQLILQRDAQATHTPSVDELIEDSEKLFQWLKERE